MLRMTILKLCSFISYINEKLNEMNFNINLFIYKLKGGGYICPITLVLV